MAYSCAIPPGRTVLLFVAAIALPIPVGRAQDGYYFGPDTSASAPKGDGSGPGGPPTSHTDPTRWETWWALNREEFLATEGFRLHRGAQTLPGTPVAPEDVRTRIIPVLVKALADENASVRAAAAIALGKCGDGNEAPALKALLGGRDRVVSEAAVFALGLLGVPEAEEPLAAVLADESRPSRERSVAAVALGLSGGETARKVLFDKLSGEGAAKAGTGRRAVGLEAARVLGAALWAGADREDADGSRSAMVAGLIQRGLDEPPTREESFVLIGTAALAKPRDRGSLSHVLASLENKRSALRAAGAIAAGRVMRADDEPSLKRLAAALAKEADPYARRMMLIALGRIGGPRAGELLLVNPGKSERQDRSFGAIALGLAKATDAAPRLREEFLKGGDQSHRGALGIGLALMGDREIVPHWIDMVKTTSSPTILAHVVWALAVTRDREAGDALQRLHAGAREADLRSASALALGYLGYTPASDALMAQIKDGASRTVRGAGATGVGRLGDSRTITQLVKLLAGGREQDLTRTYAAVALGVLGRRVAHPEQMRLFVDALHEVRHEAIDHLRDLW